MKTLNINSYVRIKITSFGIEKLKNNHEKLRRYFPLLGEFTPPEVDEKGFFKMQLWEVMKIFGEDMYNGNMNLPFSPNIQIDEAQFEKEEE